MNHPLPRSIVCATDFSRNAAHAASAAAALARFWKKPLLLLHAADEFNTHSDSAQHLEDFLRPVREQLNSEKQRLSAGGAQVTAEIRHGQPAADAILAFIAEQSADLLVVSAVSKTTFARWTLGSVSEHLAEAAPAPTLVVRDAAPFDAWARRERALKVFVAADFSPGADAALRWVAGLRELGPCEITAAHVDSPAEEGSRRGIHGVPSLTENPPEVQRILEHDLREKVAAALGDAPVEICVRASWGRVDAHLVQLATAAQADVLVVGTHQRHGLARLRHGSVSRGVVRHAPMSVVCVPVDASAAGQEESGK
ncbi:MAG: universal stress protein [Chthoniobacteraceae bacterium]